MGSTALGDAVAATRRYASDLRLGPRDEARLCIIVEELVANLIEHGDYGIEQPMSIELARRGSALSVVIEDSGAPFDSRNTGDGGIPARGGGAGLRLVRAWSKIVGYQSADGKNRLELSISLAGG